MGRVGRPHGLAGEVTVLSETDDPERFAPGQRFLTDEPDPRQLLVVRSRRYARGGLVVAFEGVDDREAADALRGLVLTIGEGQRRPLEEGEYWPEQLEGLEVRGPDGRVLGRVAGVVVAEAQDRLVVELSDGSRVDVPFVRELVPEILPSEGYVVVAPVAGLLEAPEE